MGFWSEYKQFIFGIILFIDYSKQSYGWKGFVFKNTILINEYEFGNTWFINTPNINIKNNFVKPQCPKILSIDDFNNLFHNDICKCCIYTGAGIAKKAGIWDLMQIRQALYMENFAIFREELRKAPFYFLNVVKEFSRQLYETEPSDEYYTLKRLQDIYNFPIITENRDILHQKAGHKVYTREILKKYPLIIMNKKLLVIGLSDDHSALINMYRSINPEKPLYVINNGTTPFYLRNYDYYLHMDIATFFDSLKKEYNLL
ncbi:MAG: hypothetical protein LBE13_00135 [Bacteroidales bacterium]|jgi:hypothetical protein|nr:hypothetical protein [Bacteroidales bacterium]